MILSILISSSIVITNSHKAKPGEKHTHDHKDDLAKVNNKEPAHDHSHEGHNHDHDHDHHSQEDGHVHDHSDDKHSHDNDHDHSHAGHDHSHAGHDHSSAVKSPKKKIFSTGDKDKESGGCPFAKQFREAQERADELNRREIRSDNPHIALVQDIFKKTNAYFFFDIINDYMKPLPTMV